MTRRAADCIYMNRTMPLQLCLLAGDGWQLLPRDNEDPTLMHRSVFLLVLGLVRYVAGIQMSGFNAKVRDRGGDVLIQGGRNSRLEAVY